MTGQVRVRVTPFTAWIRRRQDDEPETLLESRRSKKERPGRSPM